MESRVLLIQNGRKYHVATLAYNKNDSSIYLFVKNHSGKTGKYGIVEISQGHFKINIDDLKEDREFEHFSVHGTGQQHTKTKDGKHEDIERWTPLKGLKQARHLWTVVLPDLKNITQVSGTRLRDANIDYPEYVNGGVIDFIAMPKGIDINFHTEYTENNNRPTRHVFGQYVWELGDYRLFMFPRSSDKHDGSPERSLKISLPKDFVPFVTKITPTYVEGEVATLTYDTKKYRGKENSLSACGGGL
jgi:hypothetical protein